ncbi:hypothetical protein [Actinoplanes sp. NPDC051851]|uniref:hypothetical protein n=1 Tax=Actinoplanes sp. NPDC051851 TaxID=3154753 RepID=UPI00341ADCC6
MPPARDPRRAPAPSTPNPNRVAAAAAVVSRTSTNALIAAPSATTARPVDEPAVSQRGIDLAPFVGQGAGLLAKYYFPESVTGELLYGGGVALGGIPATLAVLEEASVALRGGTPNLRRVLAGTAEVVAACTYGWYNAIGRHHETGGLAALVQGAAAFYRAGQVPGRLPPALPMHQSPQSAMIAATTRPPRETDPLLPRSRPVPPGAAAGSAPAQPVR